MRSNGSKAQNGWILYDGGCGFCSWWVGYWSHFLNRNGYALAALQDDWVQAKINEPETLLSDIRILKPDDSQIRGADVYRDVMKHVWYLFPFYLITLLPGFKQLFDLGYKLFNKNRYKISKSCGLRIQLPPGEK